MNEIGASDAAVTPNDIIFDCPHCGKSLAIDQRGAGLVVKCPDCQQPVQVPGLPPEVRRHIASPIAPSEAAAPPVTKPPSELEEALAASQEKIARLVESLEEVRERRRILEKQRADNIARFRQVGKEVETIQHALDRIVAHLQDAANQDPGEAD